MLYINTKIAHIYCIIGLRHDSNNSLSFDLQKKMKKKQFGQFTIDRLGTRY